MIWSGLLRRVETYGDRVALSTGDRELTYSDLAETVEALSQRLPVRSGGEVRRVLIRQSDPVSILLWVLARRRSGIVPVLTRADAPDDRVEGLVRTLRPELVLRDRLDPGPLERARISAHAERFGRRNEALVLGTSGSTGVSKLAALPAESICINAATIVRSLDLSEKDRIVVNTPLSYMCGLMGGAIAGLWAGAAVHLFAPRTPPSVVQARMRRDRLTSLQAPPSVFRLFGRYWNGQPFPDVRCVATGGEPLAEETAALLREMFPNAQLRFCYGMTEAGPRISDEDLERGRFARGGIGRPYSHIEWRLDPVGGDSSLPAQVGRLVLRGPSIFLGYLEPRTGSYVGLDDDGWFHSSDLIARDSTGTLTIHGRVDRFFKSGGRLVDPASVERILTRHPAVEAARAWARPHQVLGLEPVADVVLVSGDGISEAELRDLCRQDLEAHAVPRRVRLLEDLPMTSSGKVELSSRTVVGGR